MAIAVPAQEIAIQTMRTRPTVARRLWRIARAKPVGAVAAVVCVALILVAVFAPLIAPQAPNAVDPIKNPRLLAPSFSHPLGTDNLFRDMYSRILIGSRISLGIGFAAVFFDPVEITEASSSLRKTEATPF